MAAEMGAKLDSDNTCPACKSVGGTKLNKCSLAKLAKEFFENGTFYKTDFGGAPVITFRHNSSSEENLFGCWISPDVKLFEDILDIGFILNAPKLWQVGINDELEKLQQEANREQVIDQIIDQAPEIKKGEDFQFFRVRSCSLGNGEFDSSSKGEFDSPPNKSSNFDRFDTSNFPVLYGSTDLQSCLHECRVTLEDIIYVAKLHPRQKLKLLNLIDFPSQSGSTPHDSLATTVDMLFYEGKRAYDITRKIAFEAGKKGFDGLIYPSYINNLQKKEYNTSTLGIPNSTPIVQDQIIQNLAIFGRPIQEGKLQVSSINRVFLRQSSYVIKFGPPSI